MARIRTIKPEFWTDDALTECSLSARLLFIGTWNFADDNGNLDRSSKQLKARIFPHDTIDVEALVIELMSQRLLIEYSIEGKIFLHIKSFNKHQKINRPSTSQIPAFDESLSTHGALTEHSPTEGKGREGKGKEKDISCAIQVNGTSKFEDWWKHYPKKIEKKKAKAIWKRKKLDGDVDELIADVTERLQFDKKWIDGFIPNPTTYLNGDRWEDEYQKGQRNGH